MIVVCNRVDNVGDLRLETGLFALEKAPPNVPKLGSVLFRTVLEYALARLEHQVEARKLGVLFLKQIDNAK